MLRHTLEALLRTHATAFEALWEAPERLPNGLWKWDVRHSMWVERQKVSQPAYAQQMSMVFLCSCRVQLISDTVSSDLPCETVLCAPRRSWRVSRSSSARSYPWGRLRALITWASWRSSTGQSAWRRRTPP